MTILDILNFDISNLIENDFEVTYIGETDDGTTFIDYEKNISPKLLGIFDKIQLKIFSDKFEITPNTNINGMFFSSKGAASIDDARKVIGILHHFFGKDSENNVAWNSKDEQSVTYGTLNRSWYLTLKGDSLQDVSSETYDITIGNSPRNILTIDTEPQYFSISFWGLNKLIGIPIQKVELPYIKPIYFSKNNKPEGCFIATACFGNYEAQEVIVLRKFRDEVLIQTLLGRIFIKVYYWISPTIANAILRSDSIKKAIRKRILKPLICSIKKQNTKR